MKPPYVRVLVLSRSHACGASRRGRTAIGGRKVGCKTGVGNRYGREYSHAPHGTAAHMTDLICRPLAKGQFHGQRFKTSNTYKKQMSL